MGKRATNILIGGEAGQGLVTVGQLLAKTLVRAGYQITVTQDYMSRIRGGHNTFAIRAALPTQTEVAAPIEAIDILVALDAATVPLHKPDMAPGGIVLLDGAHDACELECHKLPLKELAGKPIFENVAALGALASLLGLTRDLPAALVVSTFAKKGEPMVNENLTVLNAAYDWVKDARIPFTPLPGVPEPLSKRLMLNGNEAIVLGALAAGVKFCSFYPMTPATSVALGLVELGPKMGVLVEQAEDEIAAANMGVAASYAGARTLVPTSGGGFALMVEAVSMAGVTETPLVFVLAQRPGPATGLPTRTGQEDLFLALHAGHGEFPRAIFAPADVEQCFQLTHRAFDQAEAWQSPVFVLTDQYLADSYRSVAPFDLDALPAPVLPATGAGDPKTYERYAYAENGVSPRLVPGAGEHLVVLDSDEHTPDGHLTEDLETRVLMQDKRMKKHEGLLADVIAPEYLGDPNPDTLLVCWGSTKGAALEAAAKLRARGTSAAVLHFSQVWPLDPAQFMGHLSAATAAVCVEGNCTGQFAQLIRRETGFAFPKKVLRYDGLPFTFTYILDKLS
jgi:2-oxoglutarate ferredoxin oxidoreductase subunit alpha